MNFQDNALAAPVLREALIVGSDTVLYVHNLNDPAHGDVEPYVNAAAGDVIEFTVTTSAGRLWRDILVVTPSLDPFIFQIPKSVFGEKPDPGATADLVYTVTREKIVYKSAVLSVYVKY